VVTEKQVLSALEGVVDPELGGNVVELGMISRVTVSADSAVEVGLALTVAQCPMRNHLETETRRKVAALPGVTKVEVVTTAMTKRQRAELMSVARLRARQTAEPTQVHPTTRVIAVGSGKGGVGKSTVSVNLAVALSRSGKRVGLLDADIWGFSIPRMLGLDERLQADSDTKLIVPTVADGVKVVSTGLIIESEGTALMWRGLMLSKALEQFLTQVDWGELDYLVIDLPPGTGDVQMALSRLLPQAELIVVTTPQRVAQKVAVRLADMARRSFMPIVGVVENMSDFTCEHGTSYALFGSGGGAELAEELAVPLIGQIPIDPAIVRAGDEGVPPPDHEAAGTVFRDVAARVMELVPPVEDESCTGRIAKLLEALDTRQLAVGS
jgi:ATP-binding protein involved in chromosome partitioning